MDELFACRNSCALARFYTPATAHTLSDCFANFMREELSPSWPGINPLSQRAVCCQWLFINYPVFLRSLLPRRTEEDGLPSTLRSSLGSISIDHRITLPARLMDSCVLATRENACKPRRPDVFHCAECYARKSRKRSGGWNAKQKDTMEKGNSLDRRLEISRLLTRETPRF